MVQAATDVLRDEFLRLKEAERLVREQECIHDNSRGLWTRWVRGKEDCGVVIIMIYPFFFFFSFSFSLCFIY